MTYYDDDIDAPQDINLEDQGDGEDNELVTCPYCGAQISELAPRCPACGMWVTGESGAARRSQTWLWPVVVAILVAIILVVWHGLGR